LTIPAKRVILSLTYIEGSIYFTDRRLVYLIGLGEATVWILRPLPAFVLKGTDHAKRKMVLSNVSESGSLLCRRKTMQINGFEIKKQRLMICRVIRKEKQHHVRL
jgi:hypothetical protein